MIPTNTMDWDLKYGELEKDEQFVNTCESLKQNLMEVQKVLDNLLPLKRQYDKMDLPSQIELDLFLAYTLNCLYWVNLRIQGEDPSTQPVADELKRVKEAMMRWQEVKDREKRPRVDIEAARRFVRSGLYDPYRGTAQQQEPPNKITKFNDNDE